MKNGELWKKLVDAVITVVYLVADAIKSKKQETETE